VLIFAKERSAATLACPFELEAAALSAVAGIASQRDDMGEDELRRVREGTRAGDRIYVARHEGEAAHLFLLGMRGEFSVGGRNGDAPRVALTQPVSMIERAWTARAQRHGAVPASLLVRLTQVAPPEHRQVWITCSSADAASARSIAAAGFLLRHRLGHERWFRRLPRTWSVGMQAVDSAGPGLPPLDSTS
jgi:hypothetical protein